LNRILLALIFGKSLACSKIEQHFRASDFAEDTKHVLILGNNSTVACLFFYKADILDTFIEKDY
jgi:hypothetical protein